MIPPHLRPHLEPLANRQHAVVRQWLLAINWFAAALLGAIVLVMDREAVTGAARFWPLIALLGILPAWVIRRASRTFQPNWALLAANIEARFPELEGRLLTALDQRPAESGYLGYLQIRLLRECLDHHRQQNWASRLPYMWERVARALHATALTTFAIVFCSLAIRGGIAPGPATIAQDVTVTPGDVSLERGQTLVVMARFERVEPAGADIVMTRPGAPEQRIPLVKSLSDPLFGVSLPAVDQGFQYRLEYDRQQTRAYTVEVFEYPRLERADAEIRFPDYTGLPPKHIDDTRRVSAVQGSVLDLSLRLNKPARATLRAESPDSLEIRLRPDPELPVATLTGLQLYENRTFRLELVDDEGRTNRAPARFVVRVYPNRPPELKMVSPPGDSRPSPLEEVTFEGTVWDDFGVQSYGLAYSLAGDPPSFVPLGTAVPPRETQAYHHVLALENLGVGAEDLLSWFLWADDIGPDGELRRTMGNLYFAEIRAFDKIFREAQAQPGGSQEGAEGGRGGGGDATGELTERLKELINATWRLQRDSPPAPGTRDADQTRQPIRRPATGGRSPGPGRWSAPVFGLPAAALVAQPSPVAPPPPPPPADAPVDAQSDIEILRAAQAQVLELARTAREQQQDPLAAGRWDQVVDLMQTALEKLDEAGVSPAAFQEANAAQQAAYQALLRLQEREYSVARRNQQQNQGGESSRQQQMQNQLNQLELTQSENRYETERQATPPQTEARRAELQIMSRLRELAQRQQDLNQRFQELQTALQAAPDEENREAIRRELKRLQEQERQMLEDVDELQQRMDRPENQSQMSRQREQLDQARQDMQRAAEAAEAGEPSQALAAGTRAQRSMREMREEMRTQNAGEFTEEMREMRAEARELANRQEQIRDQLEELDGPRGRALGENGQAADVEQQLAEQAARLNQLVDRVTELSRESDEAEPLMARELYDSLRRYTQDDQDGASELERELVNRRLMTRELYERLQEVRTESNARMVEATAELAGEGYLPEARAAEARARDGIQMLREGIERAADRVLGSEAEALRLARDQLEVLTGQLDEEMQREEAERGEHAGAPPSGPSAPGEGEVPQRSLEEFVQQDGMRASGPLTGDGFGGWSDGLREVEELVEEPVLRGELARARERARLYRQAFRREGERPDWAEVRLEVMTPLVEVRGAIAEELARREPKQQLVPIDRDAVPSRYQDLVRRYYEALGRDE